MSSRRDFEFICGLYHLKPRRNGYKDTSVNRLGRQPVFHSKSSTLYKLPEEVFSAKFEYLIGEKKSVKNLVGEKFWSGMEKSSRGIF